MLKLTCVFLTIVVCTFMLSACTSEPDNVLTPTGYPKGQVQIAQLRIDGELYINDSAIGTVHYPEGLPDDVYTFIGTVDEVGDGTISPTEDFHAVYIAEGSEIYASSEYDDKVFINEGGGHYRAFKLNDHEGWVVSPSP